MIEKRYIKNFFLRTIFAFILFFLVSFLLLNDKIYFTCHDILFGSVIDFSYIKSKTNLFIGNIFGNKEVFVSSEKLEYKSLEKEENHTKFLTGTNYVVNNIENGIIVHIGEKENLGMTVIVLGDNGIHYWYSGLENISVNLYDFIESGTILGSTKNEYLYLTLNKDDEYIYYEDMY